MKRDAGESGGDPLLSIQEKTIGSELKLSRHDDHNLELKSCFELTGEGLRTRLDLYLFAPASFHFGDTSRSELRSDFISRVRLSIPRSMQIDDASITEEIYKLNRLILAEGSEESVFEAIRHLGAVLGEILKSRSGAHGREIFLSHSLASFPVDSAERLARVGESARQTEEILRRVRRVIRAPEAAVFPIVELLEEYLHAQYLEYLSKLRSELDRVLELPGLVRPEAGHLRSLLDEQLAREASETELPSRDEEHHLIHLSQLKKFFQSEMFIHVRQQDSQRKLSEPLAAAATTFAAIAALGLERSLHSGWFSLGVQGAFAIMLGITLYVFRDRLKDRSKVYLTGKLSRYLPDLERDLTVEGRRLGRIREWFRLKSPAELPELVRQARHRAGLSAVERYLPEDVLHYRKDFDFVPSPDRYARKSMAVQEILRINVERHLRHLDDPYKWLRKLDSTGRIQASRHRRIYHLYACVVWGGAEIKMFRVSLSKDGLLGAEELVSARDEQALSAVPTSHLQLFGSSDRATINS